MLPQEHRTAHYSRVDEQGVSLIFLCWTDDGGGLGQCCGVGSRPGAWSALVSGPGWSVAIVAGPMVGVVISGPGTGLRLVGRGHIAVGLRVMLG
ncbi:hypothetical protein LIER_28418 [Lithospermum erythrorhizon]|uniref:Uncharacterized protein n=1 Tax=Lithospermum erythrorhizon TaxID=34254 RepID=A0AAV3RJB9_LITER